jgi:hypothetical protein
MVSNRFHQPNAGNERSEPMDLSSAIYLIGAAFTFAYLTGRI